MFDRPRRALARAAWAMMMMLAAAPAQAANLANNGDYDNGTTGWSPQNVTGDATFTVSNGVLTMTRVNGNINSWVRHYQDVPVSSLPSQAAVRMIWKAKVGAAGAVAQPHYYISTTNGVTWSNPIFPPAITSTNWSTSDALVTLPAGATHVRFGIRLDGANASLQCDGMYIDRDLLTNGTFANGMTGWTPNATAPNTISIVGNEMLVHRADASWLRAYQDVTVQCGRRYLFRGMTRSTHATSPKPFYYYYDAVAGGWIQTSIPSVYPLSVPSATAVPFQETILIPPGLCSSGTTQLRIDLGSFLTSDVYYSNVSLMELGDHGSSLLIPSSTSAVTVDGTLSDSIWSSAVTLQNNFRDTFFPGMLANQKTTVKAAVKDDNLYLSFSCDEPNVGGMAVGQGQEGVPQIDDSVTVYLRYLPTQTTEDLWPSYTSFCVSANGTKFATPIEQAVGSYHRAWYSTGWVILPHEWKAAATLDAPNNKWYAEMEIPLTKLSGDTADIYPGSLAVNIVRSRPSSGDQTSWAMTAGSNHVDVSQMAKWSLDWTPPTPPSPPTSLTLTKPLTYPDYVMTGQPLRTTLLNDLLSNGRFDAGVQGWTSTTGGVSVIGAAQGVVSIERRDTGSTARLSQALTDGAVAQSRSYRLRCVVRRNGGGTANIGYRWKVSGSWQGSYTYLTAISKSAWQNVDQVIAAPPNANNIEIVLEAQGATGTVACFDGVSLTQDFVRLTFESGLPAGWTPDPPAPSTVTVSNGVLQIPCSGLFTRLYRDIFVNENTRYTVRSRFWKSGTGNAMIYYYTNTAESGGTWTYVGTLISSSSTTPEVREATFQVGAGVKRIRLSLGVDQISGTTAYFENCFLEQATPMPKTLSFTQGAGVSVDSGVQTLISSGVCDVTIASSTNVTIDCALWTPGSPPSMVTTGLSSAQLDILNNRDDSFYLRINDSSGQITVRSATNRGILRALARLALLGSQAKSQLPLMLPPIEIVDAPRLDYRTCILSTNGNNLTEIKNEADMMFLLGMNAMVWPIDYYSPPAPFPYASRPFVGNQATTLSAWSDLGNYIRARGLEPVPYHFTFSRVGYALNANPSTRPYLQYAVRPDTEYSTGTTPPNMHDKNVDVWDPDAVQFVKDLMSEISSTLNPKAIHIAHDEVHYDQMIPNGDTTHTRSDYIHDTITIARDHLYSLSNSQTSNVRTHVNADMLDPGQNGDTLEYSGPELLATLPSDLVLYDWKYDDRELLPSVKMFIQSGFKTVAVPWERPLNVAGCVRSVYAATLGAGMSGSATKEYGYCGSSWGTTASNGMAPEMVSALSQGAYQSWSAEWSNPEHLNFPPGLLYSHAATNYTGDNNPHTHRYGNEPTYAERPGEIPTPGSGLTNESSLVTALAMPAGAQLDFLLDPVTTYRGVKITPFTSSGRPAAVASSASPITIPLSGSPTYITFLHTVNRQPPVGTTGGSMHSNNAAYNNVSPGRYRLIYSDSTTADLVLTYRSNICDWNTNFLPRHAELGVFGTASGTYHINMPTITWKNPHPTKTLTGLQVMQGTRTSPTSVTVNGQSVSVPAMTLYLLGVTVDPAPPGGSPLLAAFCSTDANFDGVSDTADLYQYVNAWVIKKEAADFNRDEVVNVVDLFEYINAWLAGCEQQGEQYRAGR